MEQARIPLAGHLSLIHRFFGLFLVLFGLIYSAWISKLSFFRTRSILLGTLFLVQALSGIYLGRILPTQVGIAVFIPEPENRGLPQKCDRFL
jgi:hypothetical protein